VAGLGLVHSLYRAHRAVVPATAWHLVIIENCRVKNVKYWPPSSHLINKRLTRGVTLFLNVGGCESVWRAEVAQQGPGAEPR